MTIKKVWIDEGCTSCGLCEDICPEVFKVDGEAAVIEGAKFTGNEAKIKDAAESCPVEIIKYKEQ